MTTQRYIGTAPAIAQIDTGTVGGTVEIGDVFSVTIGNKKLDVPATSTSLSTTAQDIATAFQAVGQSGDWPEFGEITAEADGATVIFKAVEAGKPFTITLSTTETGGGAADAQTWSLAHTVVNSGPNDAALAANYSGNALPVDGDTLVVDTDAPNILWNLEALASVTLAVLSYKNPRGELGLADRDANGYPQYRPTFFKVKATVVEIDTAAALVRLDLGTAATGVVIKNSGTSREQHRQAICLKGSHASNVLTVLKGSVGVAQLAGETARFPDLRLGYVSNVNGDAVVICGSGCTLAAITKNGGVLETRSNVTTMDHTAGTWTHWDGTAGTVETSGGTTIYNSTGTLTTATVSNSGTLDFSRDPRAKTVTNPVELYGQNCTLNNSVGNVNVGGNFVVDFNEAANWGNVKLTPNMRGTFVAL